MDHVERFAEEAEAFDVWVSGGTDVGEEAARNALLRVTRLYLAGLGLPPPWAEGGAEQSKAEGIGEAEWWAVYAAAEKRLPFNHYAEVFDPFIDPPEEPVTGSLADDIGDIFRDVVGGLREYRAGRRATAIWEWGFLFRHHWGDHATGAIRALHSWLAANAPDRLSPHYPATVAR